MLPNDERVVDLTHAVLDGEATPAERAELEELLKASPAARDVHRSIIDVVAQVDSTPVAEPPPDLRRNVMTRIRSRAPVPLRGHGRRRAFAAAWAAAAAILITIVLVAPHTFVRRGSDSGAGAAMAPAAGRHMRTFEARHDGRTTTLVVRREGALVHLRMTISGPGPVAGVLIWDAASAAPVGVFGGSGALLRDNQAQFTLAGGDDRVSVTLRALGGKGFDVRAVAAGKEILRARIPAE